MDSIEFNNEPLILPGSVLNPKRYKLPSKLIRFPLELPSFEDLPDKYNLPMIESADQFEAPGLDFETEMQLGAMPSPYRETVRYIHSGISPKFTNGFVILSSDAQDVHHIVKRSIVKTGLSYTKAMLPFNGAIKQTFEMLISNRDTIPAGGSGNLLINLIPLDYSFHHTFIEERPYEHTVYIRLNGEMYAFTIPELLMSFNVFNLRLRMDYLSRFVNNSYVKAANRAALLTDLPEEEISPKERSVFYDLRIWERIQIELPRIPIIAQEIENDHPALYSIWKAALGPLQFRERLTKVYEQ